MGDATCKSVWRAILPVAIFSALLISGCPKTHETAPPVTDGKTATAEVATQEQQPAQSAVPPAEKPATPAPESNQSLVLNGETLLDPAVPRDAKLIQGRLAGLGFYRDAIDGVWGKNSRAALRAFKEKNALPNPEEWDKVTQLLLFRGEGPVPQPVAGAALTPISSGESLLNPSAARDAKAIQARLAELGFYRGVIDGVWGKNSRAALRTFKESKALADPEAWDRDTQILLFRDTGK
jgi:peptidoglycan hydrolase-like protein with peptidoglycan-binding domain